MRRFVVLAATVGLLAAVAVQLPTANAAGGFTAQFDSPAELAAFNTALWRQDGSPNGQYDPTGIAQSSFVVTGGKFAVICGMQNYGDCLARLDRPWTGTAIEFDVTSDSSANGNAELIVSDVPYSASSWNGATVDNTWGAYPQNGFEVDLTCKRAWSWTAGVQQRFEQFFGCVRGATSHYRITRAGSTVTVIRDGATLSTFQTGLSGAGWMSIGTHNHATAKYSGLPNLTSSFDNLSVDAVGVAASVGVAPNYAMSPGGECRALANVGLYTNGDVTAASRFNVTVNGHSHVAPFPTYPNGYLPFTYNLSVVVPCSELAATNTVSTSTTNVGHAGQVSTGNVQLLATDPGGVPSTTTLPTTTTSSTTTPSTTTTSTAPPTTTTTTTLPPTTTTAPPPTTTSPSTPGCGLAAPAFCETFSIASPDATPRGGDLPAYWGASRVNFDVNTDETWNGPTPQGCPVGTATARDIRICDGQLREAVTDDEKVTDLSMYPKQPFDFTGRTGTITVDVSNDSQGSHAAWPEIWLSDKPSPTPWVFEGWNSTQPHDGFGIGLEGCDGTVGASYCGVGHITVVRGEQVYDTFAGTQDFGYQILATVNKASGIGQMNRVQVKVSQNQIDVYSTDAFTPGGTVPPLKHIAVATGVNLSITRGLVWLSDVHYNAGKFDHQATHTFAWDNLGFDGPKTYRDLSFDVPDKTPSETGPLAYRMPVTLNVDGVHADQPPTSAGVALGWFVWDQTVVPTISVNGNPPISTPWPYGADGGFTDRSLVIPVPLSQVNLGGANTITLTGPGNQVVHNINLVLVAAAPVP